MLHTYWSAAGILFVQKRERVVIHILRYFRHRGLIEHKFELRQFWVNLHKRRQFDAIGKSILLVFDRPFYYFKFLHAKIYMCPRNVFRFWAFSLHFFAIQRGVVKVVIDLVGLTTYSFPVRKAKLLFEDVSFLRIQGVRFDLGLYQFDPVDFPHKLHRGHISVPFASLVQVVEGLHKLLHRIFGRVNVLRLEKRHFGVVRSPFLTDLKIYVAGVAVMVAQFVGQLRRKLIK